ncbi:MAG: YHS domain-containing protein, partial [Pseudaminobacter sp.]|nr:YHS domain-containing protein [Pseudaminobacter sp.]
MDHRHSHAHHGHSHEAPAEVVRDPVCGMTVDVSAGKPSAEHDGHDYHFCSASCREKFAKSPETYLEAIDPVCGMKVDRSTARHFARHEGKGHYFCCASCRTKFEASPETYIGGQPKQAPMPEGTQYTCPMHPEI